MPFRQLRVAGEKNGGGDIFFSGCDCGCVCGAAQLQEHDRNAWKRRERRDVMRQRGCLLVVLVVVRENEKAVREGGGQVEEVSIAIANR